jgi:hypothetical protein
MGEAGLGTTGDGGASKVMVEKGLREEKLFYVGVRDLQNSGENAGSG